MRLEAQGPTARVTALSFSPDGLTLHAAGYDKVVRSWAYEEKPSGRFEYLERRSYRVPLGPGSQGDLNALALSSDGKWMAVGGNSLMRESAGYREPGVVVPMTGRVDAVMRRDQGTIYLFKDGDPTTIYWLRGHEGPVLTMEFAARGSSLKGVAPNVLASVALEWDGKEEQTVVRLWDVDNQKPWPGVKPLVLPGLPPTRLRPGLTCWLAGGERGPEVLVGIALQDGTFRLWAASEGKLWAEKSQGTFDDTVSFLPGVGVIAGRQSGGRGRIGAWTFPNGTQPALDAGMDGALERGTLPRALGLCSSRRGGPLDLVACVVRVPDSDVEKEEYRLELRSLGIREGESFGQLLGEAPLWKGGRIKPMLATVPGGRFVAAGGNREHEISVFAIADLLAGKKQPLQKPLRSKGQAWHHVSFVKNGKKLGLALNTERQRQPEPGAAPRGPEKGDRIFDLEQGRLTDRLDGWQQDTPNTPARAVPPLGKNQTLTALAQFESDRLPFPLVAAAFQERGQTYLFLYNGKTGQEFRELTGHVNPITALAFSGDGRFLASVAEDQTICIWSLLDLPRALTRGMLRGLIVREEGKQLVVGEIDRQALNAANRKALEDAGIKVDDKVAGLVSKDQLKPMTLARDYYQAIWLTPPRVANKANTVVLRVGQRDVTLQVDQGIDERKPLFSLFITRDNEWVGWNPMGPYDRSDATAETLIGWHTNTANAEHPTTFVTADRYRKEYYKQGLLGALIAKGELSAALDLLRPKNVAEVAIDLSIREIGKRPEKVDAKNRPIVQHTPLTLVANVNNVNPVDLSWVRWQMDNAGWKDFPPGDGVHYEQDLSALPWQRGARTVAVAVLTQEANATPQTRPLEVLYLPPPPVVQFPATWLKQFGAAEHALVRKKTFVVKTTVLPSIKGQVIAASLWLNGKKVKDLAEGDHEQEVTLQEGRNDIVVRAENVGLLKGYETYESAERRFSLEYSPVPVPLLVIESVDPSVRGGYPPRENEAVLVQVKKVKVSGFVEAETDLTVASLNGANLPGFDPTTKPMRRLRFTIEKTLDPGEQTLVFKAQAKESPEKTWRLKLDFQPELPLFMLRQPVNLDWLDPDQREVLLLGQLAPLEEVPYTFQVKVRGKEVQADFDRNAQTLSAKIPVEPGENLIEVSAGLEKRSRKVQLRAYVRRPPLLAAVQPPAEIKNQLITLTAEAETPQEVPPQDAYWRLTHGDHQSLHRLDLTRDVKKGAVVNGRQKWLLTIANVPLAEEAQNLLSLCLENRDGTVTRSVLIQGPKRQLPRAEVSLVDPKIDLTVDKPAYQLSFVVKSASPLLQISVLQQGEEVHSVQPKEKEVALRVPVRLKPGVNRFEVVAVNEAGAARSETRTINRIGDTVFLHLDDMKMRDDMQTVIRPVRRNQRLSFDRVPGGELVLTGRLEWPAAQPQLEQPLLVQVWVNDFEQFPAEVEKPLPGKLERRFRVSVRLNQEKNNRVQLRFPGVKIDQSTPTEFVVMECARPEKDQRIHLLVVGVGMKREERDKMIDRVLGVFQARAVRPGNSRNLIFKEFQTPVFKEGRVYGPLGGDANKQEVYSMLEYISDTIRQERGALNEVIVVYFQGQAIVTPENYYLLTQTSQLLKNYERSALTRDGLRTAVGKSLGAQLLLLDVQQSGESRQLSERFTETQRIGLFEYAWLSPTIPEGGRLLAALKQSMESARLLQDVKQKVDAYAKQFEKSKEFQYDVRVSDLLGRMAVGVGN